ncbi:MAG: DUF4358 domain-containing protein [Oscillospiraceae bacterium]
MNMKKISLTMLAVAMIASLAVGCGSTNKSSSVISEPPVISNEPATSPDILPETPFTPDAGNPNLISSFNEQMAVAERIFIEKAKAKAPVKDIYAAINKEFETTYKYSLLGEDIGTAGVAIDAEMFKNVKNVDILNFDEYVGHIGNVNLNKSEVIIVKAKEGKMDLAKTQLTALLEGYRADPMSATYGVNTAEKMETAKIITEGNYAALFIVGVDTTTPVAETPVVPKG